MAILYIYILFMQS